MTYQVMVGDCLQSLRAMPDASVDSIVTDPPYGLSFMGKRWDYDVPSVKIWAECLRVLKPGGHLLAFAGTRTQHRMAVRIEDAGFEIRDMIAWVYGSGFPKSHNVANSIDKMHGAGNRGHAIASGSKYHPTTGEARASGEHLPAYEARTEAGRGWQGWGTALKPALEPITVARKPLAGTVAQNVMAHGTGALNIDGCRVEIDTDREPDKRAGTDYVLGEKEGIRSQGHWGGASNEGLQLYKAQGRWPANLIHDGSDEVTGLFPVTGPARSSMRGDRSGVNTDFGGPTGLRGHDDAGGSAARFFYMAKASKSDRGDGNNHPTVKPTDLMRYLCRLITPPGGLVLDPFCGSGSTGKAAVLEGFRFVGMEIDPDYAAIASQRIASAGGLFARAAE